MAAAISVVFTVCQWNDTLKGEIKLCLLAESIPYLESLGSKILDISCSNIFSDISAQERETKNKINKWDSIILKSFCSAKRTINK